MTAAMYADQTRTFPMLGKTEVNGSNVDPLWDWMKNEKSGILGLTRVKWNFGMIVILHAV